MKLTSSISTRVAICATGVLTVVGLAVTLVMYMSHQRTLKEKEIEKLAAISEELDNIVVDSIARLRQDVQFLAKTPPIFGIARARATGGVDPRNGEGELVWRDRLDQIFRSFIDHRPEYKQVRMIGFEDGGRELVRVDRVDPNLLVSVTGESLQRKEGAEYVQAAARLAAGAVYLSEINLNREFDQVSLPPTPMLRAATPIYGDAPTPYGLIIINREMTNLFAKLERGRPRGSELYLTSSRGDYLVNTESQATFGFDLGRPRLLQDDIPSLSWFYGVAAVRDSAMFEFERREPSGVDDYALHMTKIRFDPQEPERYLALGLHSSWNYLLGESRSVGRWSALGSALLILAGALAVFAYMRRIMKPLALVVASTKRVAAGDYDVDLPPESDDEIGQLSRSFNSMVRQIEERNNALERAAEMERRQAALQAANAELEEAQRLGELKAAQVEQANQSKSEFLARMSHDLRTPLNSMLILAKSLAENREGNLNPEQLESAQVLLGAGDDLLALVNDLLDLSKIEAGKLEVRFVETRVKELFERARLQFGPTAAGKSIDLRLQIAADFPDIVVTDPSRLRQILWNLVSNALKYTATGSVMLRARRSAVVFEQNGEALERAVIEVIDTGPGIPRAQLEQIFAPYKQLEREVRAGQGGTGLGLAIAKELSEALGGELRVDSRLGEGSRFEVRLPLRAAPTSPEPAAAPSPVRSEPAPSPASGRVLIADDDQATRWLLVRKLRSERAGIALDEAETGDEVLEAIRAKAYDCVVLDLNLPRANGWEVLRNLAADPPLKMPRMLLYTGQELTPEEHREAARLSATVAVKDGSLDVIRRMIRASLSDPGPDVLSGCRLLLVEDDTASLFALGRELRRRGAEVEEAKNGREAIETLGDRRDVDAVLMDIRMPVMDGYEAMRGIRRNAVHRDLPVLALTADATADDRDRCLAAGATEFVVKPVDPDDLVRTLTGYLGQAN